MCDYKKSKKFPLKIPFSIHSGVSLKARKHEECITTYIATQHSSDREPLDVHTQTLLEPGRKCSDVSKPSQRVKGSLSWHEKVRGSQAVKTLNQETRSLLLIKMPMSSKMDRGNKEEKHSSFLPSTPAQIRNVSNHPASPDPATSLFLRQETSPLLKNKQTSRNFLPPRCCATLKLSPHQLYSSQVRDVASLASISLCPVAHQQRA